jgi:hypothetical protein
MGGQWRGVQVQGVKRKRTDMKLAPGGLRQIIASTLPGFFDFFPGVGIDIQILARAASSIEHYPCEENDAAE